MPDKSGEIYLGGGFLLGMLVLTFMGILSGSTKMQEFEESNVWAAATCRVVNATAFTRCSKLRGGARACTYHAVYSVDITIGRSHFFSNVDAYQQGGQKYAVFRQGDMETWTPGSSHKCWYDTSITSDDLDENNIVVQLTVDDGPLKKARDLLIASIVFFIAFSSCVCYGCWTFCAGCTRNASSKVEVGAPSDGTKSTKAATQVVAVMPPSQQQPIGVAIPVPTVQGVAVAVLQDIPTAMAVPVSK
jgi:hypothetical protein